MKNIPAGLRIVVAVRGVVLRARTTRGGRQRVRYRIGKSRQAPRGAGWPRFLLLADEGVTWARGWEGEDADALRAAVALTTQSQGDRFSVTVRLVA